jgi:hypothetical protein
LSSYVALAVAALRHHLPRRLVPYFGGFGLLGAGQVVAVELLRLPVVEYEDAWFRLYRIN